MSEQTGKAPIQTLRDGAVVVKIWEQNGKNGPYTSATIGRTYKNEQTGQYGESRSLSRSDILKAQALLLDANREMNRWQSYYKELAQQQTPSQEPGQAPAQNVTAATPAAQSTEPQAAQGLAPQRDAALANAVPATPSQGPDHGPER